MSYHSLSSFSELTLQDPVTDIHPTVMKGIRQPSSRSQPTPDMFHFIDPDNIEQKARDDQDQRNQDVMPERRKENYSKQVEVSSEQQTFFAEKQKMMEEQKRMMEEQKQFLAEKQKMMEEQKQFLAEKQQMMEEQKQLMGYKANHQPQQPRQTGATEFGVLTSNDVGIISLDADDVDAIKNKITEDGNNKITSFIWFYAPWCGFCTRIIPTMEEVGRAMKQYSDKVKIYMINGDNKQEIMSSFNIRGFPTLNAYHGQSGVPTPYTGDRSSSDIINFLKLEMNK